MRTAILVTLLALSCLALSGCMTFDLDHDRKIVGYWKDDIRMMHEDIDFILYCDEPSGIGELYTR
jgi:hypothetical protein